MQLEPDLTPLKFQRATHLRFLKKQRVVQCACQKSVTTLENKSLDLAREETLTGVSKDSRPLETAEVLERLKLPAAELGIRFVTFGVSPKLTLNKDFEAGKWLTNSKESLSPFQLGLLLELCFVLRR